MTKELITYEEANRLLNYDPETGVFTKGLSKAPAFRPGEDVIEFFPNE